MDRLFSVFKKVEAVCFVIERAMVDLAKSKTSKAQSDMVGFIVRFIIVYAIFLSIRLLIIHNIDWIKKSLFTLDK